MPNLLWRVDKKHEKDNCDYNDIHLDGMPVVLR